MGKENENDLFRTQKLRSQFLLKFQQGFYYVIIYYKQFLGNVGGHGGHGINVGWVGYCSDVIARTR